MKKRAAPQMQPKMSTMDISTKNAATLKAPDGMELKLKKVPWHTISRLEFLLPVY